MPLLFNRRSRQPLGLSQDPLSGSDWGPFWEEQRSLLLSAMFPIWQEAYRAGTVLEAADSTSTSFTVWLTAYAPAWWDTTKATLSGRIAAALASGADSDVIAAWVAGPDMAHELAETAIKAGLGRALYARRAQADAGTTAPPDDRAGPPKIQQERLDTEGDVQRAIEAAWRFARERIAKIGS